MMKRTCGVFKKFDVNKKPSKITETSNLIANKIIYIHIGTLCPDFFVSGFLSIVILY